MSLFKAYAFNRLQIVTTTDNAAGQKHVISECAEVEFFDFTKLREVNLYSIALFIHLEHHSFHPEYQQVRVLCYHHLRATCFVHVCELRIRLVGCDIVFNVLLL